MCGIAGIIRFAGSGEDRQSVEGMLAKLARRGPDDSGCEADAGVVLGNRRLAILDRTSAAHQPMSSADGRYVVTYNGEIYNFRDVCRQLAVEPESLRSASDTEVLLLAWARWGPSALDRFVGQWAFAIHDRHEKRVWLARDRFGEKPLYLHRDGERIAFSSSLGSLLSVPGVPRDLDPAAVTEFLSLRYVVAPRTVIRGVEKLQPGHWLEIDDSGTEREHEWYSPRFTRGSSSEHRSHQDIREEFDERFTRACERCMVSDVPVGLLLSDGIDSNSIRAALAGRGLTPPSFTFRLKQPSGGIQPEAIAGAGGAIVDVETSASERCAVMDEAFSCLTEPVGDGASLATWMLLRKARAGATVLLCGHGGDEVLGGYRLSQDRFRLAALHGLAWMPGTMLDRTFARHLQGDGAIAKRVERFSKASADAAPAAALYLVDRALPCEQVTELFAGCLPAGERYLGTVSRLYEDCAPSARDIDRMQEVLMRTFLSANILSFADSVSMDASVEMRMPFLDRDLVDFALSLPPGDRVSPWPGRANTKLVLRDWAKGHVAADVVKRPKRGFQSGNISELLQHDSDGLRRRILGSRAVRRVIPGVEAWLGKLPDGYGGPFGGTLWALIVLGVWCESVGVE